jgi:SPW repeat
MQMIPTRIHGMMDYAVGVLLIAAAWLFGFARDGAETWVPVVLGAGVILYSLVTDYELGAVRWLPMPTHLMLDLGGGVLLAASPWLFGFADQVWTPHVIIGLIEIGTVLMSQRVPADGRRSHVGGAGVGRRTSKARS